MTGYRMRGPILAATTGVLFAFAACLPPALADPPPWAPAHGYRAKEQGWQGKGKGRGSKAKEGREGSVTDYGRPYDIGMGSCNRQALGAVLGAAAGAAAGSQVGQGTGRDAATVAGGIIGLLVGGSIGRTMDRVDQNCIGQALERAEDDRPVQWRNPDTGADYRVTLVRIFRDADGRYCREYRTVGMIGGQKTELYGTACRRPDGTWEPVG